MKKLRLLLLKAGHKAARKLTQHLTFFYASVAEAAVLSRRDLISLSAKAWQSI
jgi:hypothetical protein